MLRLDLFKILVWLVLQSSAAFAVNLTQMKNDLARDYGICIGSILIDHENYPDLLQIPFLILNKKIGFFVGSPNEDYKLEDLGLVVFKDKSGKIHYTDIKKHEIISGIQSDHAGFIFEPSDSFDGCVLPPIDGRPFKAMSETTFEGLFLGNLENSTTIPVDRYLRPETEILKIEPEPTVLARDTAVLMRTNHFPKRTSFQESLVYNLIFKKTDYQKDIKFFKEEYSSVYEGNKFLARYYHPNSLGNTSLAEIQNDQRTETVLRIQYPSYNFFNGNVFLSGALVLSLDEDQIRFLGVKLGHSYLRVNEPHEWVDEKATLPAYHILPASVLYGRLEKSELFQSVKNDSNQNCEGFFDQNSETDYWRYVSGLLNLSEGECKKRYRRKKSPEQVQLSSTAHSDNDRTEESKEDIQTSPAASKKEKSVQTQDAKISIKDLNRKWFAGIISKSTYRELVAFSIDGSQCENRIGLLKYYSIMGTHIAKGNCTWIEPAGNRKNPTIIAKLNSGKVNYFFSIRREKGELVWDEIPDSKNRSRPLVQLREVQGTLEETFGFHELMEVSMYLPDPEIQMPQNYFGGSVLKLASEKFLGERFSPEQFLGKWSTCGYSNKAGNRIIGAYEGTPLELRPDGNAVWRGKPGKFELVHRYDLNDLNLQKPYVLLHLSFPKESGQNPVSFNIHETEKGLQFLSISGQSVVDQESEQLTRKKPSYFYCR